MAITGKQALTWFFAFCAIGTALLGFLWGVLFVFSSVLPAVIIWVASFLMILAGVLALTSVRTRLGQQFDVDLSGGPAIALVVVVVVASMGIFTAGFVGGVATLPTDTGSDTASDGQANALDAADDTATPEPEPEFVVRVSYSGEWSGSISITGGGSSESKSVSGSGTEDIAVTGDVDIISANAQKQDDSAQAITIQIIHDGDVVAESETTTEYGVVQVSQSFY